MSADVQIRGLLSIIAFALVLLAARAWIEPAWAQSTECRMSGAIEISRMPDFDAEVRITGWPSSPGQMEIRPYSSSTPGSSSAYPFYVRNSD